MDREINKFLESIGKNISEKFRNINGKTAQGNVPTNLWQKRTSRKNRVLISWKTVFKNNLTIEMLNTFDGGVCVEFVNDDFQNEKFINNKTHMELIKRLGSDEKVSSIITFRVEDGDSGANVARNSYQNFINTKLPFDLIPITRKKEKIPGIGNEFWEGNIYFSIKGGSQEDVDSHKDFKLKKDKNPQLFNPAIEYANEITCRDLFLTLFYFFIHCFDIEKHINKKELYILKIQCEEYLKNRNYDEGNLYEYCITHPSLKWGNGNLIDPIEVSELSVEYFNSKWDFNNPSTIAICHNEAANLDKFKFDSSNKFIVSAARPTNLFWSKQSSNMIQQSYSLKDFFELEAERVLRRKKFLS
tara:strand:- start:2635 stop:3708 length:1074 start_codon:yes stop_codon:yes gene_type:complete